MLTEKDILTIQYDADGQHQADYITAIYNRDQKGYDIVIGSRFCHGKKKPFSMRMLGSALISFAMYLTTGQKIQDPTSGMRMFNRKMIGEFTRSLNYGPEPDTLSYLIKNGATVSEVQVTMKERMAGESYLKFGTSISYMARMLASILLIQNFRKRPV